MNIFRVIKGLIITPILVFSPFLFAQEPATAYVKTANIVYGSVGERDLLVDTYIPEGTGDVPLLVWVHGGAWHSMDKERVPIMSFLDHGHAIASVDFRLSGEAPFSAQIHDIKAALPFGTIREVR